MVPVPPNAVAEQPVDESTNESKMKFPFETVIGLESVMDVAV